MKKLDLYILKKYFTAFIFLVFLLVMIICAIDFSEKLDNFQRENVAMSEIFGDYYLNLVPFLVNYLSPILVMISTIIMTASLASHMEVTAILSSGVSYWRFLRPYLIGSFITAGVIFYMIGWVIPDANKVRVEFEVKYLEGRHHFSGRDVHFRLDETTYAYLQSYNVERNIGYRFTLESFEDGELRSKLMTHTLTWDSTKSTWRIPTHSIRTIDEEGKESVQRYGSRDTTLNLYPRDFGSRHGLYHTMTLPRLKAFIDEQRVRGLEKVDNYEVEYYKRFAYPFAIILLTMMGVIVSSRKTREGMAIPIVIGVLLAIIYYMFVQVGEVLVSDETIHPAIGAWIGNLIFTLLLFPLYRKFARI